MSTASSMFVWNNLDLFMLGSIFPLECYSFPTRGMADGIILRFKTFYLKIYQAEDNTCDYIVYGYSLEYNNPKEVFVHRVPSSKMKRYASQFDSENYLNKQYNIP